MDRLGGRVAGRVSSQLPKIPQNGTLMSSVAKLQPNTQMSTTSNDNNQGRPPSSSSEKSPGAPSKSHKPGWQFGGTSSDVNKPRPSTPSRIGFTAPPSQHFPAITFQPRPPESGGKTRPSDPPPRKPTRLQLIEDIPADLREPILEEDSITLEEEMERRRREACRPAGRTTVSRPIQDLKLPTKIVHPGVERYIGTELTGRPRWLWDSRTKSTVLAQDHMFKEGYVALSYTWGRWREGWRQVPGTPWLVPAIRPRNPSVSGMVCDFDILQLTELLGRVPNVRYFWIDVLCIPQDPKTPDLAVAKAQEIAKQGAIFKNAKGVLVYLWSLKDGNQFSKAVDEFSAMVRWYWEIIVSQDFKATTKHNGRQPCSDSFAPALRNDPWFSSLWTLQEMILAPASVWIARDGSYCQVHDQMVTTHAIANRLHDFIVRERYHDTLGSASRNISRNYVQSNIPESEEKSRKVMLRWLRWAFQETSITTCFGESRGGILLATLQRKYTGRRELAVLAALKVGNDKGYDGEDEGLVDGLSVSLWNDLIQAEGGRLFECSHKSPLTTMLPSAADSVGTFHGIRVECANWELKGNGELKIPSGSASCQFSDGAETEYEFPDRFVHGGNPEATVEKYLTTKKIPATHVRFITTAYQTPYTQVKGGEFEFTGVRGVILVTTSRDIHSKNCRWYKAGMFFSRDFRRERLDHDITVGFEYGK